MKAVIQAGGQGARLRPYTMILPKPLMPVGEFPIIEILLKWLRRNGISEIYITTGYLGHLIKTLCGDGRQWDCHITYTDEKEPLGTIGPLNLIRDQLNETFLVLNGDLLTDMDMHAFCEFHHQHDDLVTIGTTTKNVKIDLGVIKVNGDMNYVSEFTEKPVLNYLVSMGIYCMEPEVFKFIPKGIPFGFDDLMYCMLKEKQKVNIYRHEGIWMDIGRPDDYNSAQKLVLERENLFMGV